jgi:hypothetical protein
MAPKAPSTNAVASILTSLASVSVCRSRRSAGRPRGRTARLRGEPANALRVGRLPRATIPTPNDRLPVQARIVDGRAARWVGGTAHAWTRDAVCAWWTDVDCLQRIDWLLTNDVRRTTPPRATRGESSETAATNGWVRFVRRLDRLIV